MSSFLKKIQAGILIEFVLLLMAAAIITKKPELIFVNLQIEDNLADDGGASDSSPEGSENADSSQNGSKSADGTENLKSTEESAEDDYIKWVDFTVSYEALCQAYEWDVETHGTEHEVHWIELLAYTAARTGADFNSKALEILEKAAQECATGVNNISELTKELEYYDYYLEAYTAVLGGLVGTFQAEAVHPDGIAGTGSFETQYGLKAYLPIARGFAYTHYDDFGNGRSYGYKRRHLGHDMMGQTGTPIVAIESGVVEALGWNQYGGWRIGIRSFDGKRYYYYAHLRKNYPYAEHLEEGSVVTAGDVIGYMGRSGYSREENVNNIETTHLHWGLELIFDESQKDSNNEIWVDVYALTRFLAKHTQPVHKVEGTKEWVRTTNIIDPTIEK